MDELDSVLLTALAESERTTEAPMDAARAEMELKALWARTFTVVAAAQEAWFEAAFIKRGTGIVTQFYPDPAGRRRLYQFGFAPVVGRRFEPIAQEIRALIAGAVGYGAMDATARIDIFESIGNLLEADRGFGFRIRATQGDEALLERWNDVLGWWMNEPGAAGPDAQNLRSWQRFVADNLEFRLGVAIGAVVAQAWSDGAPNATATPNLANWKETTRLPWFGFWARELLHWGTHDPFVAFCLSQGLAQTREVTVARRVEFETWLDEQLVADETDNLIDPQLFQQWRASLPRQEPTATAQVYFDADLTGTDGRRSRYAVIPVQAEGETRWLDPAGFELAVSPGNGPNRRDLYQSDYELRTVGRLPSVVRTFRPN